MANLEQVVQLADRWKPSRIRRSKFSLVDALRFLENPHGVTGLYMILKESAEKQSLDGLRLIDGLAREGKSLAMRSVGGITEQVPITEQLFNDHYIFYAAAGDFPAGARSHADLAVSHRKIRQRDKHLWNKYFKHIEAGMLDGNLGTGVAVHYNPGNPRKLAYLEVMLGILAIAAGVRISYDAIGWERKTGFLEVNGQYSAIAKTNLSRLIADKNRIQTSSATSRLDDYNAVLQKLKRQMQTFGIDSSTDPKFGGLSARQSNYVPMAPGAVFEGLDRSTILEMLHKYLVANKIGFYGEHQPKGDPEIIVDFPGPLPAAGTQEVQRFYRIVVPKDLFEVLDEASKKYQIHMNLPDARNGIKEDIKLFEKIDIGSAAPRSSGNAVASRFGRSPGNMDRGVHNNARQQRNYAHRPRYARG